MNGVVRQVEPQITRSGGAPSKFRFTVRCSDCANTDTYEAGRPTSNDAVRGYFKDRGWLLGRAASFDLCPACLARPRHAQEMQPAVQRREAKALDKRHRDTADILARHLGKPEALAAEVFRPKEATPIQSPAPQAPQPTPAHSPEIAQVLSTMAADLKGVRSAVELMTEQVSQLVALGSRQIEAVAQLPPALAQSTAGLADGLRQVAGAIQALPHLAYPVTDRPFKTKAETSVLQARTADAADAELAPVAAPAIPEPPRHARGRQTTEGTGVQSETTGVVVKSIADAKRNDRFYTSIRLPRQLWDLAGFGPDDRLLLHWSGEILSIGLAAEGGVKPKSIGNTSVVLQSWKLGNVNLIQPKVSSAAGSQHLTVQI